MTFTTKTLAATTATLIALSAPAFAAGHEFDVNSARLDLSLDTDGDTEIDNDEIIDGNMAIFDLDGNGAIDADERGVAEQAIMSGGTIALDDSGMMMVEMVEVDTADTMEIDFDVNAARLDPTNDLNDDGETTDDEIIRANEAVFDLDGDGTIDANEQGIAEQMLENS
ncbi:hypothetical protein [Pseudooctadecabacter sp.]|uniref:hypothetical protein n=1 Tax=Pseudooctadecabacter sp. TaxID=1966338 RepID=UPI0025DADB36|nr:hypothetical protein [Pseudooctadecabacter sp.]